MNVTLTFDTTDLSEHQLTHLAGLVTNAIVTDVTPRPGDADNTWDIYDVLRAEASKPTDSPPRDPVAHRDPDDAPPDEVIGNTADPTLPGDIPLWPYLGDMAPLKRLGYIAQVIDHGETLTMTYTDRKGNTTKRRILPVRLVYGHLPHGALADAEASQTNASLRDRPGQWWVQAFCFKRCAYRTFRLDNILNIDPNQSAIHW